MALGKRTKSLSLTKATPHKGFLSNLGNIASFGMWSEEGGWGNDKIEKRKTDQAEGRLNNAINAFGDLDTSNLNADAKNVYADAKNVYADATNAYGGAKNAFAGAQNQFANVQNQFGNLENTAEDLTVNTQQAEFERQQFQQSQANMMSSLSAGAGSSGVAGLAQALSNQNMRQAQQSSASIGQQESQNQRMAAQQAGSNQMASAQGAQSAEMARAQGAASQQSQIMGGAASQQAQIMGGAAAQQAQIMGGAAQQQQMVLDGAATQQGLQLSGAADARSVKYQKQQAMIAARTGQYQTAAQQQADGNFGDQAMGVIGGGVQVKMIFACIPKGEKIDIVNGRKNIEDIKPGDFVIGYNGKPVKVMQKHEYLEDAESKRFYKIKFNVNGKEKEVNVCDFHKIMDTRALHIKENVVSKDVYSGVSFSYDLLTEDKGYRIDGIPVNSMIEEMAESITKLKNN